jgi:hypothetical protein
MIADFDAPRVGDFGRWPDYRRGGHFCAKQAQEKYPEAIARVRRHTKQPVSRNKPDLNLYFVAAFKAWGIKPDIQLLKLPAVAHKGFLFAP